MFVIYKNMTILIITVLKLDVCDEDVTLITFEYIKRFVTLSV